MSKRKKLLQKLRNNPKGRTKQDIETLLFAFGFILDRVSGSHHAFKLLKDKLVHRLVIPVHGQLIKSVYVKQVVEQIDALFPEDADNVEDETDE